MIVFVGHGASRTGAPRSLLNVIKWLAANTDYSFAVVLGNGGPLVEEYTKYASVCIWNQRYQPPKRNPGNIFRSIVRRLKKEGQHSLEPHQTLIVNTLKSHKIGCIFNNTGVNGRILEVLKPALNAPIISRIPELEAYMRKNNQNGSVERVLALSDHFIAVSHTVKDNLVNRHSVSPEQVSVIYGACDSPPVGQRIAKLREKSGIPDDAFVVGGCGTMEWRKGVDLFIQVANYTVNHLGVTDIYFCWIGGSVSHDSGIEYNYEIELLNLRGHLFFIGEVAETTPFLADLDLFLLTSREDPFPLVMLEAARQGLPIVCFEGGGGATEFVDDAVGINVPMLDVAAMAQAVIALKQKPEIRFALGTAAYEKSLAHSSERMGSEIFDVLTNIMNRSTNDINSSCTGPL
jgi:glycosyltransferase involved in cell wall biosynthesis